MIDNENISDDAAAFNNYIANYKKHDFLKNATIEEASTDGFYILKKDSYISTKTCKSCPKMARILRKDIFNREIANSDGLILKDYLFKASKSTAAATVYGCSINGNSLISF